MHTVGGGEPPAPFRAADAGALRAKLSGTFVRGANAGVRSTVPCCTASVRTPGRTSPLAIAKPSRHGAMPVVTLAR